MTKAQIINYFISSYKPFHDYNELQLVWIQFIDDLKMSDVITAKQKDNLSNPCTPADFKKFNQRLLK